MKRLCSVCARGGSKGLPDKNIRPVAGRPLIAHTVAQAVESGLFDAVAVSSDSAAIIEAAMAAGATHAVVRPSELATDHADKGPAIAHCGREVERRTGLAFDTFVDLDATAPLRTPQHIREAVALLEESGASNVYSVCPARRSPYFNMVEVGADGVPRLCRPVDPPILRRQDAPAVFDMNASIYAWRRDAFLASGAAVHMEGTRLYVMPDWTLFDIDGEMDFAIVAFLMERRPGAVVPPAPVAGDGARGPDPAALFDLGGRTGIVTGGAGILGATFVDALLAFGAGVVIADIDGPGSERLAARMRALHGDRVAAIACDVTDPASVDSLVERTVERFGAVDFLVNNHVAPVLDPAVFFAPVEDFAPEEWRRVMGVNLDGMFLTARAVGRRMQLQGRGGSIVQTASIYGIMASDKRIYEGAEYRGHAINNPAVYSASKAGLVGLTRWLAAEWADRGIRVNAIAPGGVFSGENEAFTARYSARVPMGRMAHRHEIAGAVVYLVAEASSYVTGQCIAVDGGLSAW